MIYPDPRFTTIGSDVTAHCPYDHCDWHTEPMMFRGSARMAFDRHYEEVHQLEAQR